MAETGGKLEGQVAVVTGAGRGIGRAVAKRLASLGATVLLVARSRSEINTLQKEIEEAGGKARARPCDLLHAEAIAALGDEVRRDFGRCDILVNNAGIPNKPMPLHQLPVADWELVMGTNLRAPYLMMKAFAPMMIERHSGHIINISSLAGRNPLANGAVYSASKWGLNGLTYSVAEELRGHGVRASVIAPGSVNTHFDGGSSGGKDPLKRIQPEDIASIVALLVTQEPQGFISEVLVRPTQK